MKMGTNFACMFWILHLRTAEMVRQSNCFEYKLHVKVCTHDASRNPSAWGKYRDMPYYRPICLWSRSANALPTDHRNRTDSSDSFHALFFSDFAGHTLRIYGGDGIFLDVVWLSKVLKPILNHKLKDETFDNDLSPMRDDLVEDGVLRWQFAWHLWRDFIGHAALQSKEIVVAALLGVLVHLGVALPLSRTTLSTSAGIVTPASRGNNSAPPDMLVIMRLEDTHNASQRRRMDRLPAEMPQGDQEVTFKWRFGFAGPPHGLVERLLASCHVLGEVERSSCWKYGAVFKSGTITSKAGKTARLYTLALSYDDQKKILTVRVFGPLECDRVWMVSRYVASAMVKLSKDWPGAWWEGWTECAQPNPCHLYLASSKV